MSSDLLQELHLQNHNLDEQTTFCIPEKEKLSVFVADK